MRFLSLLAALALLTALNTAQAADVDTFDILGMQLGDDLKTVKAKLAKHGFERIETRGRIRDVGPYTYLTVNDWEANRQPPGRTIMAEIGHATGLYKLEYVQEPLAYSAMPEVTKQVCQKYGNEPPACQDTYGGLLIWRDDQELSKSLKIRVAGALHMRLEDRDAYFANLQQYRMDQGAGRFRPTDLQF